MAYPSYIIDRAKSMVGSNIAVTSFLPGELMEFFNDAVDCLVSEGRNRFPMLGAVETTITQVSGTTSQTWPADFDRFLRMRHAAQNWNSYPVPVLSELFSGLAFSDTKVYWVNQDANNSWTLLYTFKPVRCHAGTAGTIAGTTDAPTMVLATDGAATTTGKVWPFADFYNRAQILITSATTGAWQRMTVEDCAAGSPPTVTFSGAWPDVAPTGTVTYEVVPMIDPQRWEALLAMETANRIMGIQERRGLTQDPRSAYTAELRRWTSHWTHMNQGPLGSMRPCPVLEAHAGYGG